MTTSGGNGMTSTPAPPPLPAGRVVAVPGRGELFVRTADGPSEAIPVMLIHGWQATADMNFFPLYQPLASRHPVIAADLRGHGRSLYPETQFTLEDAADDNAALLAHLGIARAIVVGYSIGTAVTQVLVDRHPDLVAGMVLIGGELRPASRPHEKVYNRIGGWQGTAQRVTAGRWGAHRVVSKSTRENPDAEVLRHWLVGEMERGHSAAIRGAGRALGRFDGRPIAPAHNVPASVVITRRDRLVRPPRQEALATAWRAEVIDLDADHDAPVAQPKAFVEAVLTAVSRVSARVADGGVVERATA
jgi:3-oxoadipate enol-lactonase